MTRPNIIYILADDMGYGDLGCNNPASRIPTPNLDRLGAEGMRFTNAHAPSSFCTPSRYAVLTRRYCWRSRLQQGIVWQWDAALPGTGRLTVADVLRNTGYATDCIGKWHLGWDWSLKDCSQVSDHVEFGVYGKDTRDALGGLIRLHRGAARWTDGPWLRQLFRRRRAQLPTVYLVRKRPGGVGADAAQAGRDVRCPR